MKLFHRHTFDPEKWKEISREVVAKTRYIGGGAFCGDSLPMGEEIVYSNTCTDCGDLVFRRVQEVE